MFNTKLKRRIKILEDRLDALSGSMWGESLTSDRYNRRDPHAGNGVKGEISKLKAVVSEVVDYVYRENK